MGQREKSPLEPSEINLKVFITHFVPPQPTIQKLIRDFVRPRLSRQYFRSWARLLKHGSRGHMPWKKDVMTQVRHDANRNRLFHLNNTLLHLTKIPAASLEVCIHTNSERNAQILRNNWHFLNIAVKVHSEFNDMNVLNNSPWENHEKNNPWLLTWKHKSSLSSSVRRAQKNCVYVCMEDDALFTQDNLAYFLRYKEKLKSRRLIPSFLRIEWSFINDEFIPIDHFEKERLSIEKLARLRIQGRDFVALPNPYSGIIVLDQDLAEEYVSSPAATEIDSRELTWWDIGARSAMGLQFVNVPKGFNSRNVLLVDRSRNGIDVSAWIAHQPNIYAQRLDFLPGLTPNSLFSRNLSPD